MKTHLVSIFSIGYLVLSLISCGDNAPGCPFCDNELKPTNVNVPDSTEALQVEMAWVAVEGSPTVADPSIVCEDNYNDVLYRRHIRANSCVWTKQCKIILTPLLNTNLNYNTIIDPNQEIGLAGDIIDNPEERIEIVTEAFNQVENQFKGIVAIQIRKFITPNGSNSTTLGRAATNMGRPYLIITDPEYIYEDNPDHLEHISTEQVLAHEIGHSLNLCHATDPCLNLPAPWTNNLMIQTSNVENRIVVESQCNRAREFLEDNLSILSPNISLVDVFYDTKKTDLMPNDIRNTAFSGLGIVTNKMKPNNFKIMLPTKGLVKENARFVIGVNIDNQESTGGNMDLLDVESQLKGVDIVIEINSSDDTSNQYNVLSFEKNQFIKNVQLERYITNKFNTINEYIYTNTGCTTIPSFNEIEIEIDLDFLELSSYKERKVAINGSKITMEAFSMSKDEYGILFQDKIPKVSRAMLIK